MNYCPQRRRARDYAGWFWLLCDLPAGHDRACRWTFVGPLLTDDELRVMNTEMVAAVRADTDGKDGSP